MPVTVCRCWLQRFVQLPNSICAIKNVDFVSPDAHDFQLQMHHQTFGGRERHSRLCSSRKNSPYGRGQGDNVDARTCITEAAVYRCHAASQPWQSIISACSRCSCFCAFACVLLCRPTSVTIDCLKFLAPSVGWVRLQSVLGSPRAPCSMHAVALLRALLI